MYWINKAMILKRLFSRFRFTPSERLINPELRSHITHIADHEGVSAAEMTGRLLRFALEEHRFDDTNLALWATLTDREKEAAALTCLGYTNQQIARKMVISPNTVKTHLRNVLTKFKVNSKAQLAVRLSNLDFDAWDTETAS